MRNIFILILTWIFFSCNNIPQSDYPLVRIETQFGDIILEIYNDKAPQTSEAFLANVESNVELSAHPT